MLNNLAESFGTLGIVIVAVVVGAVALGLMTNALAMIFPMVIWIAMIVIGVRIAAGGGLFGVAGAALAVVGALFVYSEWLDRRDNPSDDSD